MTFIKLSGLIALLFLMYNCSPQVEDNSRGFASGQVVDKEGAPVKQLPIEVRPVDDEQVLGFTNTDENGRFKMVTTTVDRGEVELIINAGKNRDSLYTQRSFIQEIRYNDDVFDVGQIILRKKALLNLNITKTTQASDTLRWRLEFKGIRCNQFIPIVEGENYENQACYPVTIFRNIQTLENPNFSNRFKSVQNSEVRFIYKTENQDLDSISIQLNQYITNYEFNY